MNWINNNSDMGDVSYIILWNFFLTSIIFHLHIVPFNLIGRVTSFFHFIFYGNCLLLQQQQWLLHNSKYFVDYLHKSGLKRNRTRETLDLLFHGKHLRKILTTERERESKWREKSWKFSSRFFFDFLMSFPTLIHEQFFKVQLSYQRGEKKSWSHNKFH